eukprot:g29362.t1
MLLVFEHPVWRGKSQSEDILMALLLGLAKLATNRSRQRALEGVIMANCLPLFCGYFHTRVSLEKEHAVGTGALDAFGESSTLLIFEHLVWRRKSQSEDLLVGLLLGLLQKGPDPKHQLSCSSDA